MRISLVCEWKNFDEFNELSVELSSERCWRIGCSHFVTIIEARKSARRLPANEREGLSDAPTNGMNYSNRNRNVWIVATGDNHCDSMEGTSMKCQRIWLGRHTVSWFCSAAFCHRRNCNYSIENHWSQTKNANKMHFMHKKKRHNRCRRPFAMIYLSFLPAKIAHRVVAIGNDGLGGASQRLNKHTDTDTHLITSFRNLLPCDDKRNIGNIWNNRTKQRKWWSVWRLHSQSIPAGMLWHAINVALIVMMVLCGRCWLGIHSFIWNGMISRQQHTLIPSFDNCSICVLCAARTRGTESKWPTKCDYFTKSPCQSSLMSIANGFIAPVVSQSDKNCWPTVRLTAAFFGQCRPIIHIEIGFDDCFQCGFCSPIL